MKILHTETGYKRVNRCCYKKNINLVLYMLSVVLIGHQNEDIINMSKTRRKI